MTYRIKWIEEHLGITRDMIRHYEDKKLLSKNVYQNPLNRYREYDDDDIATLWGIKLLLGIGYSVNEIKEIFENRDFDFYASLSKKVKILEEEYNKKKSYFEFAKTIQITGRIPTVKDYGSVKFDDFLSYARENWNYYADPELSACIGLAEKSANNRVEDITYEELEEMLKVIQDAQAMQASAMMIAHYKAIASLKSFEFNDDAVQAVVSSVYGYICSLHSNDEEFKDKTTPSYFAKTTVPMFLDSEISELFLKNEFSKDERDFIALAIAHFGGYANINEI